MFIFHDCKFSLSQVLVLLIFNSYISILQSLTVRLVGRLGLTVTRLNLVCVVASQISLDTDNNTEYPDRATHTIITPSCTPSDWAAISCPSPPRTQTGCSRCLWRRWSGSRWFSLCLGWGLQTFATQTL